MLVQRKFSGTYGRREGIQLVLSAIKQWLQDIDAYSLQRPQRYKIQKK